MSQEKVDKRKYEKYHRKEIEKKNRMKITVTTIVSVVIVGMIIGIPLGYKLYEMMPRTISPNTLDAWVSAYVSDHDDYPFVTEAEADSTEDATEDSAE